MSPEDQYKSIPALRRAVELVEHRIKMVPTQHSAKADLAEYLARLGDSKGALITLDKIPEAARGAMASRVVIAFELCGRRTDAIRAVRSYFKNPLTLREVLDEPVLAKLHQDPEFKRAVEEVRTRSSRPL